jgi:hypothetical protein
VQGQHVRDGAAGVLLGQDVIALRQQTAVERILHLDDPARMKGVEDTCFDACPVMHGHGRFSCKSSAEPLYTRPWAGDSSGQELSVAGSLMQTDGTLAIPERTAAPGACTRGLPRQRARGLTGP